MRKPGAAIACYLAAPGKSRADRRRDNMAVIPARWRASSAAIVLLASGIAAQELDLRDVEGRIEYAWFTEDANTLRNLIRTAEGALPKSADSAFARYQLGFAHYRLGQLLAQRKDAGAGEAFSGCVDELDRAVEVNEEFADAYALQSACYVSLASLQAWRAVVYGPQGDAKLDKARQLAPRNPRVVLLDAVADAEKPKALGGDKARAHTKIKRAVELFEATAEPAAGEPNWGAAEAYLYLGRGLMQAGDTLGARNALEQALIIAPEFAAARRELQRLTGGPRQ
jgi:tetratricopeptide (TPR) repeat protein